MSLTGDATRALWAEFHALRKQEGAAWEAYGKLLQEEVVHHKTQEAKSEAERLAAARIKIQHAIGALTVR